MAADPTDDHQQPAVEFDDVTLSFSESDGVFDLSFTIPEQSIVVLIGPSGCGKSTVLRLILGLHAPDTGQVRVLGHTPTELTLPQRKQIAYVPQEFALYPMLTVVENVRFASSVYGLGPFRRSERIEGALDVVELNDVRGRKADDLSGGMRRRLQLAAALLNDADLLAADEPTAGVDPILRVRIWEHMKKLRDRGKTIIVTTQYIDEAEYGDIVFVMREGELLASGTPDDLRQQAVGGRLINVEIEEGTSIGMLIHALEDVPGIRQVYPLPQEPHSVRIRASEEAPTLVEITDACREVGIEPRNIQPYILPFSEVFQRIVNHQGEEVPRA